MDFDANNFIGELFEASKCLGILEAKIAGYQFDRILIPMLHKKEAVSTIYIEGTQTTISDILESKISPQASTDKTIIEANNHTQSILYDAEFLRRNSFSHSFIKELHRLTLRGIVSPAKESTLGKYKKR